jgi:hypothetical protein
MLLATFRQVVKRDYIYLDKYIWMYTYTYTYMYTQSDRSSKAVIEVLLKEGANIDAQDDAGGTALQRVAFRSTIASCVCVCVCVCACVSALDPSPS